MAFFDARIITARITAQGLRQEEVLDESGYAPRLSPDGRWVAFLRITDTAPTYTDLWLKDMRTLRASRISANFYMAGVRSMPRTLLHQTLAWSADGTTLFYVTREEGGVFTIHSLRPDQGLTPATIPLSKQQQWVPGDLHMDRRGRLSLMTTIDNDKGSTTYSLDICTDNDPQGIQVYQEDLPAGSELRLAGWLDGNRFVLQRTHLNAEQGYRVEILLGHQGDPELTPLAEMPHAFPATAYLDPAGAHIFISAADGALHNLAAINLHDGSITMLTKNLLPGVTFADFLILKDESLLYGVQRENSDIWLVNLDHPSPTGP